MERLGRALFGSMPGTPTTILLLATLVAIALLQACGGSSSFFQPTTSNPLPGATLQAIQITPSTSLISLAESRQLTATGIYSNGSKLNISSQVTWSASPGSSTTNSVSVTPDGVATGMALGGALSLRPQDQWWG